MKRLVPILIATLLVLSLLVISCNGNTTTSATTNTTQPTTGTPTSATTTTTTTSTTGSKYGGVMKVAGPPDPGGPFGWPSDIIGAGSATAQPALECLLRQSSTGEYIPWLAESYTIAEDGSSITFKLREGVKFHDGSVLNADVVKFNFDSQIESFKTTVWKSVEVIDDLQVKVNITKYQNTILDNFADNTLGLIASKESYLKNGQEWADKNPVGTGPFVFVEYQQNTKAVYERFDDYWIEGKPYLDGLEILYISDDLTMQAAMQSGELDMMNVSMGKQQKTLQDLGFISSANPMTVYGLVPDTANADSPLANKSLREAIEYSIDKVSMSAGLGYGTWEPVYQIIPRANGAFDSNPAVKRVYDVDKAKQLLTESGYNGEKIYMYSAPAARQADAEAAIQSYMQAVGINVELKNIDQASFSTYQTDGWKNGMLIMALAGYANYNASLNYYFGSTSTQTASWLKSEEFKTLLDASLNSNKLDYDLVQTVSDYISENALVIPTTESGLGFAYADYVKDGGFGERALAIYWNMDSVWLDK
jgi:peptide/nickel transport system substrate-binding protein